MYYPQQPPYPNQQGSYPGQPAGAYPGQSAGTYPGNPTGAYPSQPTGAYPGQSAGTYPGNPTGTYPSQPTGAYPGQQSGGPPGGNFFNYSSGYPGQFSSGYPGYPSGGYQGGYVNQPTAGYQPQPGFQQNPPYQPYGSCTGYSGNQPYYPPQDPVQLTNPGSTYNGSNNYGGMFGTPTIRPNPSFNANADAEMLHKAMKGLGCNKGKIIAVLCARSNSQRQEISTAFKTMYGKSLHDELKSELSGDFEDLILGLMELPADYDAYHLHKAMAQIGTKESVLIEIMCSRTNSQINEIKSVYRKKYGNELEHDIVGDTSGYFQRLLVSMCAAGRDESMRTDPLKANQDAHALYKAGEKRLGTDETCFNAILAAQNYAQLRLVFQEYQKVSGHSIEKAIESEFSSDVRDGLLAVVACVQNRQAYFAKLIHDSMEGFGTRDTDLIRLIVTRSEIDLGDVKQEYQRLYKKSLVSAIKDDCSGAYKDGLVAVVNGN